MMNHIVVIIKRDLFMLCKDKRNRKLHEIRCEIRRLILQLLILTFGRLLSGIFYFCCEVERRQDFSLLFFFADKHSSGFTQPKVDKSLNAYVPHEILSDSSTKRESYDLFRYNNGLVCVKRKQKE